MACCASSDPYRRQSTLGKVIALMQNAERSKPPITRLLERYAGSYMVLVLLLAAVTWFVTNDAQAMLAVLVAACPAPWCCRHRPRRLPGWPWRRATAF
jgi:cation transport ATPase